MVSRGVKAGREPSTKEVSAMENYKDMHFCQSCGMPLLPGTELGTESAMTVKLNKLA